MGESPGPVQRLLSELRRRNVYRVMAVYAVVAFVVLQLADLAAGAFGLPAWFEPMIWALLALGLPVALVVAWAFELTPEGVRRTAPTDEEPAGREGVDRPRRGRFLARALVGVGLLAALGAVGWWYLTRGAGGDGGSGERTVAVLPFQVSGEGAQAWRDGMVSLLGTGLDGAAGLRAIADRTVFAAWEQRGLADRNASAEEAVSVARDLGAQYALVGSAAALGSELQLTADLHATASGDRLGKVEVRGSPDSVTALAHDLTRRAIGLLAEETGEGLGSADLAAVTTQSTPALKLYLRGLQRRRSGDTEGALEDYRAAIRADGDFALPYARIAFLGIWEPTGQGGAMQRAHELSEQLPERERRLIRALHTGRIEYRTLAAADSLRRLTGDYPDDPAIWETLGEFVYHEFLPRGHPEVEEIHRRAVALDPGHSGYYDHFVPPAIYLHRDSTLAAKRIEAMPDGPLRRVYRVSLDLAFGAPEARRRALRWVDTVPPMPQLSEVTSPLAGPEDGELLEPVLRRLIARDDLSGGGYRYQLFTHRLERGRVEEALAGTREVGLSSVRLACELAFAASLGIPVPDSAVAARLEPESLVDDPAPNPLLCAGLHLVDRGRGEELDRLIVRLRAAVEASGGPVPEGAAEALEAELSGYRAWRAGELRRAAELWSRSNEMFFYGAIWRGDVLRRLGNLREAEGWYLVAWYHPVAHEKLGRLYEEMDEPEEAAAAYRRFVAAWEDADAPLQGRVAAARERLAALSGDGDQGRPPAP